MLRVKKTRKRYRLWCTCTLESLNPQSLESCNNGFAYIGALILVVVTTISLSSATTYWSTTMKREREKELLYRGDAIRRAIESYAKASGGRSISAYPRQLKDLLRDGRSMVVRKHLRRLQKDPMTDDGEWGLVRDRGYIKGVYSKSIKKPLKTGNFHAPYEDFEKALTYADWKFVYDPKAEKTAAR